VSTGVVARISKAALRNNLNRVREAAPGCRILAVVKANAYGHGLEEVAGTLSEADAFAVARVEQGVRLRRSEPDKPIVILSSWIDDQDLRFALEHRLELVVHDISQIDLLEKAAEGRPDALQAAMWLKIDSGMGRLGIAPAETGAAVDRIRALSSAADGLTLMTHLACADELDNPATGEQLQRFGEAIGQWDGDVSIANSAAILGWPDTLRPGENLQYSGSNWVRPGLMLYGVSPFRDRSAADLGLEPAMTLAGQIVSVRRVPAGSSVGYGGEWRADRDSVVGTVNIGYGDGYPWRIPGGTPVVVGDSVAPVIGRISMDLISIDLTDFPDVKSGERAVLWGRHPDVASLADRAGTIAYELLTGVGSRVQRVYE
jgi:alanine racemase